MNGLLFGLCVAGLAFFDGSGDAPTIEVRTEAELRAALSRVRHDAFLHIDVYGEITLTETNSRGHVKGLYCPPNDCCLRLRGMTPDAAINFNMTFDGDWRGWVNRKDADNGFKFRGKRLHVRELTFRNFNWLGGAVRPDVSESAFFFRCRFENIGSILFPTTRPAADVACAQEVLYTGAAVGGRAPRLTLYQCTFHEVGRGVSWNHAIYPGCERIAITKCTFTRCGNPLALGYCDRIAVVDCRFDNACETTVDHRRGRKFTPGWIMSYRPDAHIVFKNNRIEGCYADIVHQAGGTMVPERWTFDHNDYRDAVLTRGMFWHHGGVAAKPLEAWLELGFDQHSRLPVETRTCDGGF